MKLRKKFLKYNISIRFFVLLAVTISQTGCDFGQVAKLANLIFSTHSPYPVEVSKLAYAASISTRPIIWIDNDRILIPGATPTSTGEAEKSSDFLFGLYIWDTKNDTYTLHKRLKDTPAVLCYHNGNLIYSVASVPNQDPVLIGGPLGEEKELQPQVENSKWPELTTCKNLQPETDVLPEHSSVFTEQLRKGDGYLYLGLKKSFLNNSDGKKDTEHIKLYSFKENSLIDLPILLKEYSSSTTTYSEYGNKYVFVPGWPKDRPYSNNQTSWPLDKPLLIYIFSSEGKVSTTMVPPGHWNGRPLALPTKKGLLIVTNNAPGANSKNAGGYLLTDKKMIKLYDHLTNGIGVSPNGCKVVFSYNDYNRWTKDYMKVIDLCK